MIIIDFLVELWDAIKIGLLILFFVAAGFATLLVAGGLMELLRPIMEAN